LENKRRYKRYILDITDVRSDMIFATDVTILDISLGGISLKADKRLNMGSEYIVRIRTRDDMIRLRGEVIWALLSEHRETPNGDVIPIYKAGLKFTRLSDEKSSEIVKFIENYKREVDTALLAAQLFEHRLFRRLKIDIPEGATVIHRYEGCRVKALSFSGMLMESEFALNIEDRLPMKLSLAEDKAVVFQGRVASCDLMAGQIPALYELGIEFHEMSEEDKDTLRKFISLLDAIDTSTPSLP
jgi:c-di-GMP-binding flagellar brake protein YcgR